MTSLIFKSKFTYGREVFTLLCNDTHSKIREKPTENMTYMSHDEIILFPLASWTFSPIIGFDVMTFFSVITLNDYTRTKRTNKVVIKHKTKIYTAVRYFAMVIARK